MSSGTLAGKRGLMGALRIPKLYKDPTLTYDANAVEIDGKGFSGTIPISAISAVFIEKKKTHIIFWIGAIWLVICCIGGGIAAMADGGSEGAIAGVLCLVLGLILLALALYLFGNKAVFSIISDGYAYTLSVKGNEEIIDDWEKAKDELSKIVVAGRKAVN
jgi:hypothetical protein